MKVSHGPLLMVTLFIACSIAMTAPAFAEKIVTDWDHELDMSSWNSFRWAEDSVKPADDLARARVESAILDAFEDRGMRLVEDGEADFLVRYHAITDQKTQQSFVRLGVGLSRRIGGRASIGVGTSTAPKAKTVEIGTLILDVLNPATGQVAWTAKASETLKGDPEKRRAQIDAALRKALAKFPPHE